jgi:fluoride ion exporter CrcB/FEX
MDLKNKQTKAILIGTLIGGFVYAGLMTIFDYSHKQDFSIGKFSANFIFLEYSWVG